MTDQQLPSVTDSDVESSSGQSSTIADRGGTDQFTSLSPSTITDSSRLNATRLELEKWQYQHTIQLVKLELSQKNMIIDSLKAEHQQQIEELQDNLAELKCDVKLHQQRLVAISKIHQDEKKDLKRQLEEANRLREAPNHRSYEADFTRDQIEQVLQQPLMTEDEYNEIIKTLSSSPSICDIVKIRLYELTHPFVNEGVWLRNELEKLQSELKEIENTCKTIDKKYLEQEKEMNCLQVCYDQLLKEKEKLNNQERHFDFKSQHYDTIKSERDTLERELEIVKRTLVEKEIREQSVNGEMEKAQKELTSCQHQVTLLRQDKDYLQRQVDELTVRFRESEERIGSLNSKLTDVTQSKEELYEQFLKQKREQKSDYETRLQQELETLRVKTNSEIDQIKVQTREMYERENRVLSQSRDGAMADRDRAVNKQKELEEKYEQAINE
jgi:progesterone-induced-blocking factor 1